MVGVTIKRRTTLPTTLQAANTSPPQQQETSKAETRRAIELVKDKLNLRYLKFKGAQETEDKTSKNG